jgi:DNA processing protein
VAIVGARAATPYGEVVARELAVACVESGGTVVSGGAFGIDAAAHRGALDGGGTTVCVLASAVDMPYPRGNDLLLHRIAEDGLLVSESPLGQGPRRQRFLTRNRLIAALSRGTVVVEAALRSGSASTAASAYALNRQVLAVPGPITSPMSAGCHRMIADGHAALVGSSDDVVQLLGGRPRTAPASEERPVDRVRDVRSLRVHDALPARGSASLDRLIEASGLGAADVLAALADLQVHGLAAPSDGGWRLAGRG